MEHNNQTEANTPESTPPPATPESAAPATAATEPTTEKSSRMMTLVVGLAVFALAIGGYYYLQQDSDRATGGNNDAAAIVNGEVIARADFENNRTQTEQAAIAQGADPNDPTIAAQIEDQIITSLVNITLLLQAARQTDIAISDEAVAEQQEIITTQFGGSEAVAAELERLNMTEADLMEDIREQLLVDQYVSQEIDVENITVSEEDIATFYAQLVTNSPDAPTVEEVGPQIEQQLIAQQQQVATQALIERLRAEAEIEILI